MNRHENPDGLAAPMAGEDAQTAAMFREDEANARYRRARKILGDVQAELEDLQRREPASPDLGGHDRLGAMASLELQAAQVAFAASDRTVDLLREQNSKLNAELNVISERMAAVLSSTSWVATWPIRSMGRRLPVVARAWRKLVEPLIEAAYTRKRGAAVPDGSSATDNAAMPPVDIAPDTSAGIVLPGTPHAQEASGSSAQEDMGKASAFGPYAPLADRRGLLVSADMPPMADKHSGSLRLHNLIRIFDGLGLQITFGSIATREQFNHL